jgi:hypothetical protein
MNFDQTTCLQAGSARPTSVRVYDASGKPMKGVRLTAHLDNAYLASVDATDAVTDANGVAKLQLEAKLPGLSTLTVGVDGAPLERTIDLLTTVESNMAARPTAKLGTTSIGAGAPAQSKVKVTKGTKLTLSCATKGATIYYTTDGSCPCQNTPGHKTYTGPLTINASTHLIIGAYKDGMDYSERLDLTVTAVDKAQPLKVSPVTKVAKATTLKMKAVVVARPLKVSGAKGTLSFKKASGAKQLTINAKTGKVTVKKGTKKGTYTIKVKVTSGKKGIYKAAAKTVTCKVVVK